MSQKYSCLPPSGNLVGLSRETLRSPPSVIDNQSDIPASVHSKESCIGLPCVTRRVGHQSVDGIERRFRRVGDKIRGRPQKGRGSSEGLLEGVEGCGQNTQSADLR